MRVWIVLPFLLLGQSPVGAQPTPSTSTLPPIGLPLPPIGLPLPSLGLAPLSPPAEDSISRPVPDGPRRGPRHRGPIAPAWPLGIIYIAPGSWLGNERPPVAPTPSAPAGQAPTPVGRGRLLLDITPPPSQVWIDGYFVGSAQELAQGLVLEAGPHRVELRESEFETSSFDVRLEPDRVITYRGVLRRLSDSAAGAPASSSEPPATPPIARKTLYFIPGCYLGDVPPAQAGLPPSCDLAKTLVYEP